MSRCSKVETKARSNPNGLAFRDLLYLAECYGFIHKRTRGSHQLYAHPDYRGTLLNFQPFKGNKAKPYQVRQLLKHIDALSE